MVKDSQSPPENGSVEKDEASIVSTSRGALALKMERSLYLLSDLNVGLCGVSVSRWTKAHDILCQQKIQKFQIAEVVRESNAMLR